MKLKFDWVALGIFILIVVFGWFNIYAACFSEDHPFVFDFSVQHGKQLIWMAAAGICALIVLFLDPRIFANTAYIIYIVAIALLCITLVVARAVNGGQSWIDFGAFKFQPSEFAKLATALAVAKYMGNIDTDIKSRRGILTLLGLIGLPAILVLLQHDTGSALVFIAFVLPLFREGLSKYVLIIGTAAIALFVLALVVNKYIVIGIILLVCLAYLFVWLNHRTRRTYTRTILGFVICSLLVFSVDFAFQHVLEPHQRERIDVLLGKSDDIKSAGYNVYQAKIAIGSGGFFGKGWTKGTITKADFVPEQETDFIFCTVGEEWGFWGSALVIAVYIAMLLRLVRMAERQRSRYARFYGYSVASILFVHFLINVGMVLGLVPVIGIPLPFFSYGGSSLIAFSMLLFIFIRLDAERTQNY